ncbi:MAG: restriction endonuclease subunit S [Bacteroidota bacterium]|nr:restriction endonuclease subunit S [Bacteroidota bacterium]
MKKKEEQKYQGNHINQLNHACPAKCGGSDNWDMSSSLKELAEVEYGASPKEIRVEYETVIKIFGTGGLVGFAKEFLFEGPLVVVARKGTLDKPVFSELACWVIDTAYAVRPKQNVDAKWLYYQLANFDLKKLNEATGVPSINRELLYKIRFPKTSLLHQRRISRILSTADAVIEKTQAAITKYKAIKQGMLHDLFTRGIDLQTACLPDRQGKLRPKYEDAPELYKPASPSGGESKLGMIPNEWSVEIFGAQIELVHGHQFRNFDFTEYGVPVVKIGQVKPENVDLSNCSYVSAERMEEFKNETIRNGDVLMALTGATLGKACLVSGLSSLVLQNYRVGRFEPKIKENDIDKVFLYYTLTAGELLNQIFNKVNSGAQGNIGKADFEKAFFKKPEFKEQKLIAERLNSLNQKLHTEQTYLHKLQQLKSGLMGDLLSGRKKVSEPLIEAD